MFNTCVDAIGCGADPRLLCVVPFVIAVWLLVVVNDVVCSWVFSAKNISINTYLEVKQIKLYMQIRWILNLPVLVFEIGGIAAETKPFANEVGGELGCCVWVCFPGDELALVDVDFTGIDLTNPLCVDWLDEIGEFVFIGPFETFKMEWNKSFFFF